MAVCFTAGTLIRTTRGDVRIEDLAIGDIAVTASFEQRPIRWLGHRAIDCRRHPRSSEVMPVRIAAHAFGPDRPSRDLLVSPGHAICVDVLGEVLVPAGSLVNGSTIRPVEVDAVTYWHVELDGHDILLAENLPAESYCEMGNRGFFAESDLVALDAGPDAPVDTSSRTYADFCRPVHVDGPVVEALRMQLRRRATLLGWTLEQDPLADLHLEIDGARVEPVMRGLAARFLVPADAKDIWLVSKTATATDGGGPPDLRQLGLCLKGLTIVEGFSEGRRIDLDDPRLCTGFHEVEDGIRRWTAGRAHLPAALSATCPEAFFLTVELAGPALPRWVAPAGAIDREPGRKAA